MADVGTNSIGIALIINYVNVYCSTPVKQKFCRLNQHSEWIAVKGTKLTETDSRNNIQNSKLYFLTKKNNNQRHYLGKLFKIVIVY